MLDAARTLLTFKPPAWQGAATHASVRLLEGTVLAAGIELPWIVYGEDAGDALALYHAEDVDEGAYTQLHQAAEDNLAKQSVQTRSVSFGELSVVIVERSYYAAEKVLDEAFMNGLHAQLGDSLLLAGIPRKGELWVTAGAQPLELTGQFARLIAGRFEQADARHPALSPQPLLVSDGAVSGILLPRIEPNPGPPDPPDPDPTGEDALSRRLANAPRRLALRVAIYSVAWLVGGGLALAGFAPGRDQLIFGLLGIGLPPLIWSLLRLRQLKPVHISASNPRDP